MEKMTKKEKFALIAELVADNQELVDFCNDEIARLDAKALKAKEKAAERKAQGDELYAVVVSVVGSEPMTAEQVLACIDGEELTTAKIRARLSQAVNNGVLVKETVKIEGKNKVVYSLAA